MNLADVARSNFHILNYRRIYSQLFFSEMRRVSLTILLARKGTRLNRRRTCNINDDDDDDEISMTGDGDRILIF